MKTTTLEILRKNFACQPGYDAISARVGKDFKGEIPLETILDNPGNGINDCIWSLRATNGGNEIAQEFAIRIAMKVYFEPSWVKWANNWLNGTDRSNNTAYAAVNAALNERINAANVATNAARAAWAPCPASISSYTRQVLYATGKKIEIEIEATKLLRSLIN